MDGARCWYKVNYRRHHREAAREGANHERKKPDIDRIFHALGDPTRRAMMERLSRAPCRFRDWREPLDMSLAALVQHMQVLEECGLVETEKVGRVRSCRIASAGLDTTENGFGIDGQSGNASWIGWEICLVGG